MRQIFDYLSLELNSPLAAKKAISKVLESCGRLKDFPFMGAEYIKIVSKT